MFDLSLMENTDAYMNNNNNKGEEKEEAAISQNSLVAFGAHRAHSHTEMVGWLGEETTESLALFRQGESDPNVASERLYSKNQ